ncbi:MAG: hypothetical protein WCL57_19260, partial [Chloroflexota bacterium]
DFQPRNVFWHEPSRRITVIDWNLLGVLNLETQHSDMQQLCKLLYRLVMGHGAPQVGTLVRLAQPNADWQALSLGLQDLLARGLQPDRGQQFATPHNLKVACQRLLGYWERSEADLRAELDYKLSDNPSAEFAPEAQNKLHQVSVALLQLKQADDANIAKLYEDLQPYLRGERYLQRALVMLEAAPNADTFVAVNKALASSQTQDWGNDVALRRARVMAYVNTLTTAHKAADPISDAERKAYVGLLNQLQHGEWTAAVQTATGLCQQRPHACAAAHDFEHEALFRLDMAALTAKQQTDASLSALLVLANQAQTHFKAISYGDQTELSKSGAELKDHIALWHSQQDATQKDTGLLKALNASYEGTREQIQRGMQQHYEWLYQYPDNIALLNLAWQKGKEWLKQPDHWPHALTICEIAAKHTPTLTAQHNEALNGARGLRLAQAYWKKDSVLGWKNLRANNPQFKFVYEQFLASRLHEAQNNPFKLVAWYEAAAIAVPNQVSQAQDSHLAKLLAQIKKNNPTDEQQIALAEWAVLLQAYPQSQPVVKKLTELAGYMLDLAKKPDYAAAAVLATWLSLHHPQADERTKNAIRAQLWRSLWEADEFKGANNETEAQFELQNARRLQTRLQHVGDPYHYIGERLSANRLTQLKSDVTNLKFVIPALAVIGLGCGFLGAIGTWVACGIDTLPRCQSFNPTPT